MKKASFQREQMAGIYLPHIEPFNRMVDELRSEEWMPYVAPLYGGVNARVLAIFRDPGPKTQEGLGSGMLCVENDDVSAERHYNFLKNAGIEHDQLMVWNAYPWYINRKPRSSEIDRGLGPLKRVVELCPNLEVVMAHGGEAQVAWKRFRQRHPSATRGLTTIETYHTSRQALQAQADERARREAHLTASFAEAAAILREVLPTP
ncbi:uracil-DNA glycosylase [Dietzia kunjamensis]|nr:uracil-DNA glycosylase [Dietzia kunjamensis]